VTTTTTGQQLAAALRKSFKIGPRTRDGRDRGSLKREMLESIANAILYPGYYGEERTALSSAAWGTYLAYEKHVLGFRVDPELREHIVSLSPWYFAALLGDMVDAGVTTTGEGERYFQQLARDVRALRALEA
jgi:hypothetical protein